MRQDDPPCPTGEPCICGSISHEPPPLPLPSFRLITSHALSGLPVPCSKLRCSHAQLASGNSSNSSDSSQQSNCPVRPISTPTSTYGVRIRSPCFTPATVLSQSYPLPRSTWAAIFHLCSPLYYTPTTAAVSKHFFDLLCDSSYPCSDRSVVNTCKLLGFCRVRWAGWAIGLPCGETCPLGP